MSNVTKRRSEESQFAMAQDQNGNCHLVAPQGKYIYKSFGCGLTIRTLSPNAMPRVPGLKNSQDDYFTEDFKGIHERRAKLNINTMLVAAHGVMEASETDNSLVDFDSPGYTVAMIIGKIKNNQVNELLLENIKDDLAKIIGTLGRDYSAFCLEILSGLSSHEDKRVVPYLAELRTAIGEVGETKKFSDPELEPVDTSQKETDRKPMTEGQTTSKDQVLQEQSSFSRKFPKGNTSDTIVNIDSMPYIDAQNPYSNCYIILILLIAIVGVTSLKIY